MIVLHISHKGRLYTEGIKSGSKVLDACLIILVVVTYHSAFPLPTLDIIKSVESQF